MNKPTHVAPRFLVVGFGRSFIARSTMRKKPIAVQEILWGISAAGDRGYNGLGFPRSATAATTKNSGIVREFTVDEANDLQEY